MSLAESDRRPVLGQPLDRVDGPAKVTGRADYATEQALGRTAATGFMVEADIGAGRVTAIDTAAAEAAPGVLLVLTHENAPEQAPYGKPQADKRFSQTKSVLESDRIRHHGLPVALIVAETFEAARHAASLVKAQYEDAGGAHELAAHSHEATKPKALDGGGQPDQSKGKFLPAFDAAPVRLDVTYTTPNQHHVAMEPHATLADWDGKKLTLNMTIQILSSAREAIARTLKISQRNVRILSPYIGGGFGSKLGTQNEAILASLASMRLGRPVKIAQTRRQMFANAPHRGEATQRIRLGAEKSGKLVAVGHDAVMAMARFYPFAEPACSPTRGSYATPNLQTTHRVVPLDIPKCDSMRAPGEAIGSVALECAMDELAHELGMDPLELRLLNEPRLDPAKEIPFASRDLERCLREGAARFGWEKRHGRPGTQRDGRYLIGTGMAIAIRPNILQPANARVRIGGNGQAVAQLDMTDIGTGSYTILTQIVADELRIPVERVVVELGDSNFPQTAGSGGSFGAASAGSALQDACRKLKDALVEAARADDASALHGVAADLISVEGDTLTSGGSSDTIAALIRRRGKPIMAEGSVKPGSEHKEYAQYSYGAHFVEVGVDADTGETRIRRYSGAFSFGRILNRKTARSQVIGGVVWGIGTALHEETVMDPRNGAFVNRDLAEYHVPVNRDVPALDIVMIEEPDEKSNPLGSKGVGELAICGAAAAIGNAVFNATGIRIRDFPITLDKLVTRL